MATNVLAQLLEELDAGRLKVVDLTTPLEPETPVIDLPPIFAPSPGLTLTEISRYDSRGPGWYWNIMHLGEHTGTHSMRLSIGSLARTYPIMRPIPSHHASSSGQPVSSILPPKWRNRQISC